MPRPLRIEYPNAWYHVMNRGAGYRDIYLTKKHRQIFLDVLKEAANQFEIEIHAYCLMGNHYHLLVKTPQANLGRAMRHINGVYTQRYNKIEKTDGPLFRGRYKALIIEGDAYLLQVSRYIHLNPIAAKITKFLEDYPWSSYLDYVNKTKKSDWLKVDEVRAMLNASHPFSAYKKFIAVGVDQEMQAFYDKKNIPMILGSKAFKENVLSSVDEQQIKQVQSDYNKTRSLPGMDDIDKICIAYFKIDKNALFKVFGKGNEARHIAIYGGRVWAKEMLSVIADHYHCRSHSGISKIVKNIKERIALDAEFAKKIEKMREMVFSKKCQVHT